MSEGDPRVHLQELWPLLSFQEVPTSEEVGADRKQVLRPAHLALAVAFDILTARSSSG